MEWTGICNKCCRLLLDEVGIRGINLRRISPMAPFASWAWSNHRSTRHKSSGLGFGKLQATDCGVAPSWRFHPKNARGSFCDCHRRQRKNTMRRQSCYKKRNARRSLRPRFLPVGLDGLFFRVGYRPFKACHAASRFNDNWKVRWHRKSRLRNFENAPKWLVVSRISGWWKSFLNRL